MNPILILVLSTFLLTNALSEEIPVHAPAPITAEDCACKCRPTIYKDLNQIVQWCFINSEDCEDKFGLDKRFNLWKSYKGCSSPSADSAECLVFNV